MHSLNQSVHEGVPCASGDGVLSGRCVAVSDLLKEEHRRRVIELLQHLRGVCVRGWSVGVGV